MLWWECEAQEIHVQSNSEKQGLFFKSKISTKKQWLQKGLYNSFTNQLKYLFKLQVLVNSHLLELNGDVLHYKALNKLCQVKNFKKSD